MTEDDRIRNLYDDVFLHSGTRVAGQLLREDADGTRHPVTCPECGADRDLTLMQSGVLTCPAGHNWRVPGIEFPIGEAVFTHTREHQRHTGTAPRHNLHVQQNEPAAPAVTTNRD